jgi:hypothetical protein
MIYQAVAAIATQKTRLLVHHTEQNQYNLRARNRERRQQRRNMLEGMRATMRDWIRGSGQTSNTNREPT